MRWLLILVGVVAAVPASAQQCFPECRPGFVCSPEGQCVSICNPPCGEGQICTAEARCIDDPSAQQQQQQQPYNQGYGQQPQQQQQQYQQQPQQQTVGDPQFVAEDSTAPTGMGDAGSFRLQLGGLFGFAGKQTLFDDDGDEIGDVDLEATVGLTVRGIIPVGSALFIGFGADFGSYVQDGSGIDRSLLLAVDFLFGFRIGIEVASFAIEPFGGLAVGFAALVDDPTDETAVGLDVGLEFGANFWFTHTLGAFFSLGWKMQQAFAEVFGQDIRVAMNQMRMNVGLSLRFGASAPVF
ncbi:MAG: hypothetical protein AAGE52_24805 [Myxococcota bacterium]